MIANDEDVKIQVLAPAGSANALVVNEKYRKIRMRRDERPDPGRRRTAAEPGVSTHPLVAVRAARSCRPALVLRVLLMVPSSGWWSAETAAGARPEPGPAPSAQRVPLWANFRTSARRCPW